MTIDELNKIIKENFKYPVYVSEIVYPEVERLYLDSYYKLGKCLDKLQIAEFYQKYDYVGIRNALSIVDNYDEFKKECFNNLVNDKPTCISKSQLNYLTMIGWNVSKLNSVTTHPWFIYS